MIFTTLNLMLHQMLFVMQIRLGILKTENLRMVKLYSQAEISYHGVQRNKALYLYPVLRLNIDLQLLQLLNYTRMLLQDLGISLSSPPTLWCDNMRAISLVSNLIFHARTKRIEVDNHFIREKVHKNIMIRHISTHDQIANVFTKDHTTTRFTFLRSKLMVIPIHINLQGTLSMERFSQLFSSCNCYIDGHQLLLHYYIDEHALIISIF